MFPLVAFLRLLFYLSFLCVIKYVAGFPCNVDAIMRIKLHNKEVTLTSEKHSFVMCDWVFTI